MVGMILQKILLDHMGSGRQVSMLIKVVKLLLHYAAENADLSVGTLNFDRTFIFVSVC